MALLNKQSDLSAWVGALLLSALGTTRRSLRPRQLGTDTDEAEKRVGCREYPET